MKTIEFIHDFGKTDADGLVSVHWDNNGRRLPQIITVRASAEGADPYDDYGLAVDVRFLDAAGNEIAEELFAGAHDDSGTSFKSWMTIEAACQLWPARRDEFWGA